MEPMRDSRNPFQARLGNESTLNSIWQQHYHVQIECCHAAEFFALQIWHNSVVGPNVRHAPMGCTVDNRLTTHV